MTSGSLGALWQYRSVDFVGQTEANVQSRGSVVDDCVLLIGTKAIAEDPEQFVIHTSPLCNAITEHHVELIAEFLPRFRFLVRHAARINAGCKARQDHHRNGQEAPKRCHLLLRWLLAACNQSPSCNRGRLRLGSRQFQWHCLVPRQLQN